MLLRRKADSAWPNLLLLVVVLNVASWVFWEGSRLIRADAVSLTARQLVGLWASGAKVPASQHEIDAVREALQSAIAITPVSSGLQEQLGDLYVVAGRRDWHNGVARKRHFGEAEAQYQKALALRPLDPQTWASLAAAYQGLGDTGPRMHQAWEKALQLGPNEGHVQPMLLELALATWPTASPAMQKWAETLFDASAAPQREAINTLALRYGLRFNAAPTSDVDLEASPAIQ